MKPYDQYLNRVLKGTYLRRREKLVLYEEMENHLQESTESFLKEGLSEEEAYERSIESFGTTNEIRKRIVRETFVISPRWFLLASILSFIGLLVSLYTVMRFNDILITPDGLTNFKLIPNPRFVVWLHTYFPLEPNRWAVLTVLGFMLLFARESTQIAWRFISVRLLFVFHS